MSLLFDEYRVRLKFVRDCLGTNPCDPNIHDVHIIGKQRQLILEKSEVNSQINKYLNALQISDGKAEDERARLIDSLERLTGVELTPKERADAMAGKLESLRETLKELGSSGTTIFFWDKDADRPCISSHMILGFMKAAGEAICRARPDEKKTMLQSIAYTQSIINQHVAIKERFIVFDRDIKRRGDGSAFFLQRPLRAKTAMGQRVALAKSEVVEAGASLEFTLRVLSGSKCSKEVIETIFEYGQLKGIGQWRNSDYGQFEFEIL